MEDLGMVEFILCILLFMGIIGPQLGVPLHVFGPESHMTSIVAMALGKRKIHSGTSYRSSSFVCNQYCVM